MSKCKFCEREINPEETQKWETWGIISEFRCPKCMMLLETKLNAFNKKSERSWKSIKDIIKKKKYAKPL